jgi:tetratricopeptide (TPR) repeat protein
LLAETLNRQGNDQLAGGDMDAALTRYDRALSLAPHYIDACNNRAVALWNMGRFEEALAGSDSGLARRPDYVKAHFNRGNVLRDMLRLDEAMTSFDRATAIDPGFAPAHRNKGFCALLRGDFEQGLPLYEWRKGLSPPIEARSYPQPLWTGAEDVRGKMALTYVEQGLGDTTQFWRFIAPLQTRGAHVSRAVPPDFDFFMPLISLPLALRLLVHHAGLGASSSGRCNGSPRNACRIGAGFWAAATARGIPACDCSARRRTVIGMASLWRWKRNCTC